jgi:hypothetical protein
MAKPLTLEIGAQDTQRDTHSAMEDQSGLARNREPAGVSEGRVEDKPSRKAGYSTSHAGESLAEIYEILKRHEETLRDLIVEVRLLYHNLPESDRLRLEGQRDRTTREVGNNFASQVQLLDEAIAAYRQAQPDSFGQSAAQLEEASSEAVSTLLKVMVDPNTPPAAKVKAADSVLDHAAKAIELREIDARLSEPQRAGESRKGK